MSKIVKSLMDKGLVQAVAAPQNRRLILLAETHEGGTLLQDMEDDFTALSGKTLGFLEKNELQTMIFLLSKLDRKLRLATID